jgi:para-nitrobenzyl esterase
VLPLEPSNALASGQCNWSSVLLGSNHDEAALFVAPALLQKKVKLPLSTRAYQAIVVSQFRSFAPAVLNEYPLDHYRDPFMTYADEVTDYSPLGCTVSPLSETLSRSVQTYRFEFDDTGAPLPGGNASGPVSLSLGAYHGSELQYLFTMNQLPGPQTAAQHQLSDQMTRYWTNFVKTGNPNGASLVEWPHYAAYTHQVLSLRPDGNVVIDNFDADHHCAFWATAPGPPFD